mgnify:FL=1
MAIKEHFAKMLITVGWFSTGAVIVAACIVLYKGLVSLLLN